ncbi:MAG: nitroreductase family protein [Bacillota bacterium]|jgi:nitroreductase
MTAVIDAIMSHASIRRFTDQDVPDELIEKIARAGQQAPFTGQMYACIYTKDKIKRERLAELFGPLITRAPVFMLYCLDFRKLEKFIASKGRTNTASDAMMLFLGIQDVAYFAQNMVLAAESLGLGTCFLGSAPNLDTELRQLFQLPERVYPVVGMVLGYPAESPAARPRIPTQYVLHKDNYHDLSPEDVSDALSVMDAGLIREGYYRSRNSKIPKPEPGEDQVGFDQYGWGEHISRKYARRGQFTDHVMDDLRRAKIEP